MTFLVATQRTNATLATGLPSNTIVGGAATMSNAVADNSDTTGIRLDARASLDAQRVRLQVQPPALDAADRVYSIGLRIKMRSVVLANAQDPRPLLLGWLRTQSGDVLVDGDQPIPRWTPFDRQAPTDPVTSTVQEINLGEFTSAPGGEPWSTANMATLVLELGRGDDTAFHLDVIAVFFDVYYQQPATITMTGPPDPNPDTAATLTWDWDSSTFAPPDEWRAGVWTLAQTLAGDFQAFVTPALFTSGQAGVDADSSWWVAGQVQQWTTGQLTDGDYVGIVQGAAQWPGGGGRFLTEPASIAWTRDAAAQDPPEPAVLTSVVYSREQMRNLITITPGSPTDRYTIFRTYDAGPQARWVPASPRLTLLQGDGNNPVEVWDRFMKLNTPARYRVVAYAGTPLVGALEPSNEITVTPQDDRVILRHPTNDLLDTAIVIKAPQGEDGVKRTKYQTQGVADFSGGPGTRALPMVLFGMDNGWEYDLTLLFIENVDPDLWARVELLDGARCPLFLQWPMKGEQLWGSLGPGRSGRPTEEQFQVVAGNIAAYKRIVRKSTFTECQTPMDY